jgi:hypothetical protein
VRRLGGQLRIDSYPGRGTAIAAELPLAPMNATLNATLNKPEEHGTADPHPARG